MQPISIYVRDKATDEAVRKLAALKNLSLTEAIREAVVNEYDRERAKTLLAARLDELAKQFARLPKSRLKAGEAFYDDVSGGI